MAKRAEAVNGALEELSSKLGFSLNLKEEQTSAVNGLLDGKDVLGVLPTGFGKSMIYQVFVLASKLQREQHTSVLVISPLNSIIEDQIDEANAMGISAVSLGKATIEDLRYGKFQLLFASAESALEGRFVNVMKDQNSSLHQALAAIVVDESHVVEMWTGKRTKDCTLRKRGRGKHNQNTGFREAFGRLSTLRSFCKEGTKPLQ